MTIEIDYKGLTKAMEGVYDALIANGQDGDAKTLLVDEAKRLNIELGNFTPPMNADGGTVGAEAAGKHAIERELKSLVSEAQQSVIDDTVRRKGSTNVDEWVTSRDGQKVHIRWDNIDQNGSRMRELHRKYKGRRGKVPLRRQVTGEWRSRVVVPIGARAAYIAKVQDQVGKWKASVSGYLVHIGKRLPRYVRKHVGSVSALQILDVSRLNDPMQPSVMFGSRFPGIGNPEYRYHEKLSAAVRRRKEKMLRRAQIILAKYSKNITDGVRARRCAKQTATETEPEMN